MYLNNSFFLYRLLIKRPVACNEILSHSYINVGVMITFYKRRDHKIGLHGTLPRSKPRSESCEFPLLPYISPINLSAVHEAPLLCCKMFFRSRSIVTLSRFVKIPNVCKSSTKGSGEARRERG